MQDNYQGEESDVVIVSLTRSNPSGDIGFMAAPERLIVLLSRARKALVLIGNSQTFLASRKGGETSNDLFDMLAESNCLLECPPVKCEQHAEWQQLTREPSDFDSHCPDGGCSAPWYVSNISYAQIDRVPWDCDFTDSITVVRR